MFTIRKESGYETRRTYQTISSDDAPFTTDSIEINFYQTYLLNLRNKCLTDQGKNKPLTFLGPQ